MRNEVRTGVCLKRAALAAAVGLGAGAVAALITAVPAAGIGASGIGRFSWIVLTAAALTGGAVCGGFVRQRGLLWGAVSGLMLYAALLIAGLAVCKTADVTALIKGLLCVGLSAAGGAVTVNLLSIRRRGSVLRRRR